jgi:mRNA-degrading endonuclease toxin of MazEF toxin-antitoxin module
LRRRPSPRRGEIWLARTPDQPLDPHQPRYVLIVSDDDRNAYSDDVLGIPIYSRGRGPTRIPIRSGEGGIEHDSVLFCEEITCLDEQLLEEGPLDDPVNDSLLRQVVRAVLLAIDPDAG